MPFNLGFSELLIVGILAVLLFGERLPEVAQSIGKQLMAFKKNLRDLQHEVTSATSLNPSQTVSYRNPIDDYEEPTAPKFEPPTQEPQPVPAQDPGAPKV